MIVLFRRGELPIPIGGGQPTAHADASAAYAEAGGREYLTFGTYAIYKLATMLHNDTRGGVLAVVDTSGVVILTGAVRSFQGAYTRANGHVVNLVRDNLVETGHPSFSRDQIDALLDLGRAVVASGERLAA